MTLRTASLSRGVLAISLALAWLGGCNADPHLDQPEPSPLVFEISGPDNSVEGWMLGTIHALPDGTRWRTPATKTAISEADYVIVEIANLGDPSARKAFAELSSNAARTPLTERVAPELRDPLGQLIKDAGLSADTLSAMDTWAVALTLAQTNATGDPRNGVDRAVIAEFAERGVREFEGSLVQLRIFDNLAPADQRTLLEEVISDASDDVDQSGELREAWLTGEIEELEEATTTGMMADPELREAILTGRNRAWAARLLSDLEAPERPLVAVGTAHLVGPEGLPALLEQAGYSVRAIN